MLIFSESSDFENGVPRALTALAILGTVDRLSTFSQRIKTSLCGIHPGFKADGPIMYYDIAFCQLRAAIRFDDDRVSSKQRGAFRIRLWDRTRGHPDGPGPIVIILMKKIYY